MNNSKVSGSGFDLGSEVDLRSSGGIWENDGEDVKLAVGREHVEPRRVDDERLLELAQEVRQQRDDSRPREDSDT